MKRRQFIKTMTAAATAPLMPSKMVASPLPVSPEQYAKAVHWAGLWVHSTAATYQNILGVDHSVGKAVLARLQQDGIVGALDANGIARAIVPHYEIPQVAARLKKAMQPKPAFYQPPPATSAGPKPDLGKLSESFRDAQSELEIARRPEPRPDQSHPLAQETAPLPS